jgi:hypothetical protein
LIFGIGIGIGIGIGYGPGIDPDSDTDTGGFRRTGADNQIVSPDNTTPPPRGPKLRMV